jgi:hypothetical protein
MNDSERIARYFATRAERAKTLSGVITGVGHDATTGKQTYWDVQVAGSTVRVPLGSAAPTLGSGTAVTLEQSGSPSAAAFRLQDAIGPVGTAGVIAFPDGATVGGKTYPSGDWVIGNLAQGNIHVEYDSGRLYHRIGTAVHGIEYPDGSQLIGHATFGTDWAADGPNVLIQSTGIKLRNALVDALDLTADNGIRMYSSATQRVWFKPAGDGWLVASDKFSWDTSGNITLAGAITAGSGAIGGWTIGANALTGGNITLNSATPAILLGAASAYGTGTGAFLGNDGGTYKLRVGNPSGNRLTWDGTDIAVNGLKLQSIVAGTDAAVQGWQMTTVFSSTDADTVSWASGSLILTDGTTYGIGAGNTGNMAARTYIYLATGTSTTAFQTTTTAANAVGAGKILVAVAEPGTVEARFQVFGGYGGLKIAGGDIEANSITASKLTVTAGGANLLLNSSLQVDADSSGTADRWYNYNNTFGTEPTTNTVEATGGVDNRAFQRLVWSVTNTSSKGILTTNAAGGGGVQGGWAANTTYVVSWWAKANLSSATAMELGWNTSPTFTWLARPTLSTAWQRYAVRITWGASVEASGALFIGINYGAAVTGTLDIDHVQVEQADTPSAWKPYPSEIEPGTIIASYLAATAIDGMTMTAPIIRTAASGARTELNSSNLFSLGFGGIGGYDGSTPQWYAKNSDGKLYAGGGDVIIDTNGITLKSDLTAASPANTIKWARSGVELSSISSVIPDIPGTSIQTTIETTGSSLFPTASTTIKATPNSGTAASLYAYSNGTTHFVRTDNPFIVSQIRPASDSTTALQLQNASATAIVTVDTTNSRLGIGCTPGERLHVSGTVGSGGALTARFENLSPGSTANPNYIRLLMTGSGGTQKAAIAVTDESYDRYGATMILQANGDTGNTDLQERFRINWFEAVVNDQAQNVDFRVETDSAYNALFVDASNDSVAVMNHASGKVGFYGGTPVTKQALASYTGAVRSSEYYATGDPENYAANVVDLNALRTAYENLRIAFEDLRYKMGLTTLVTAP